MCVCDPVESRLTFRHPSKDRPLYFFCVCVCVPGSLCLFFKRFFFPLRSGYACSRYLSVRDFSSLSFLIVSVVEMRKNENGEPGYLSVMYRRGQLAGRITEGDCFTTKTTGHGEAAAQLRPYKIVLAV